MGIIAIPEGLQTKLPVPKNQQERFAVVDAFSKTCLTVANKLLAMELTPEQHERAVQLKVVALTTRANIDEEAADQLDAFVEENLKNAKTDEELIKAYQLKLQVLAAKDDSLESISALADELYSKEQEELKDEQLDNVAGGGLFSSLFVDWPIDFSSASG